MTLAAYLWSDDFWNTVITALIAVAVGIASIWAALYVANPRRGIVWEEVRSAEFWATDAPRSVEVKHNGDTVRFPALVDIRVKNVGRRDVEPGMFSAGDDSLIFDLKAPIIEVVDSSPMPSTGGVGATSKNGSRLRVHPFLLSRGHSVTYSVLVDLESPYHSGFRRTECTTAQITHNPIRSAEKIAKLRKNILRSAAALTAVAALFLLLQQLMPNQSDYYPYTQKECQEALKAAPPFFERYCKVTPKPMSEIPRPTLKFPTPSHS